MIELNNAITFNHAFLQIAILFIMLFTGGGKIAIIMIEQ